MNPKEPQTSQKTGRLPILTSICAIIELGAAFALLIGILRSSLMPLGRGPAWGKADIQILVILTVGVLAQVSLKAIATGAAKN